MAGRRLDRRLRRRCPARGVRRYHDPNYGSFSHLMRMEFDSALQQFTDASIDLLHIDGCHTYEAVRHDFEAWLPKLSDRGVVILHDTAERREGFGVWKFWAEISNRYPGFSFCALPRSGDAARRRTAAGAHPAIHAPVTETPAQIGDFFAFQGRRIEILQTVQYVLAFAWQAQTTLNQWCAAQGKPVNASCGSLQLAQSQPLAFLYQFNQHAQRVFGAAASP